MALSAFFEKARAPSLLFLLSTFSCCDPKSFLVFVCSFVGPSSKFVSSGIGWLVFFGERRMIGLSGSHAVCVSHVCRQGPPQRTSAREERIPEKTGSEEECTGPSFDSVYSGMNTSIGSIGSIGSYHTSNSTKKVQKKKATPIFFFLLG